MMYQSFGRGPKQYDKFSSSNKLRNSMRTKRISLVDIRTLRSPKHRQGGAIPNRSLYAFSLAKACILIVMFYRMILQNAKHKMIIIKPTALRPHHNLTIISVNKICLHQSLTYTFKSDVFF